MPRNRLVRIFWTMSMFLFSIQLAGQTQTVMKSRSFSRAVLVPPTTPRHESILLNVDGEKSGRVNPVGQFVFGCLSGVVGGLLVPPLLDRFNVKSDNEEEGIGMAVISGLVGVPIGSGIGVSLFGRTQGESGRFGASFGGGILGGLVGALLFVAIDEPGGLLAPLITAPIGAVIGYQASQ